MDTNDEVGKRKYNIVNVKFTLTLLTQLMGKPTYLVDYYGFTKAINRS